MDEIDKQIIDILKKDASTPLSKIADMIGIPRPTVYLRFNKLKENGVIKGFSLILAKESNKKMRAAFLTLKDYLLSDMSSRSMKEVGEKLSKRHEIIFAAKISRDKILVIWEGSTFHPMEYREVISIEEIETDIFKCP